MMLAIVRAGIVCAVAVAWLVPGLGHAQENGEHQDDRTGQPVAERNAISALGFAKWSSLAATSAADA
jgi:hypothetical protein